MLSAQKAQFWLTILLFAVLLAGCASYPPTPIPTPTPIPGFVGGEEKYAYTSFIEFYKEEVVDCHWGSYVEADWATFLDIDYPGSAVYVGDGIWRFHVQIGGVDATDRYAEPTYREEIVEWRSLSDRTWEDKCDQEWQDPRDHEPDYPDDSRDFEDPPEDDNDFFP